MEHKEAIEIVKKNYPHVGFSGSQFETALRVLVPELAESEDERIRNEIIDYLNFAESHNLLRVADYKKKKGWLAYLEKQKEQKPARWLDGDMSAAREDLIACCRDWERGEHTTLLPIVATRARYFLEHLVEPQKPAEWSKEDEKMLTGIIERGSSQIPSHEPALREEQMEWLMNRLRSLRPRPHWKPSEEQMKCLEDCVNRAREMHNASTSGYDAYHTLSSLYNDLEKL